MWAANRSSSRRSDRISTSRLSRTGREMSLSEKLRPDRFSAMSGKMAAIVGYILGESWSEPEITALSVTSDGFVTTESEFFGEAADLDRNILNLLLAADLSAGERAE